MPLNTIRFNTVADVIIDESVCTGCGLCVRVCKGAPLTMRDGRVNVDQGRLFGCIGCGHCMAACPTGAIRIDGRDMTPDDAAPYPTDKAGYDQLYGLMLSRRSMRDFRDEPLKHEDIDKIISAVSTAPMGVPPTNVGVTIINGCEKVQQLRREMVEIIKSKRWFFSPVMLTLMRPFLGKDQTEMMKSFVAPVFEIYTNPAEFGDKDWFTYDAPAAMLFYAAYPADPGDAFIAATYAALAAESLGIGACMLGFPANIIQFNKQLKEKYCGSAKAKPGILVVLGYPAVKYKNAVKRRMAEIRVI